MPHIQLRDNATLLQQPEIRVHRSLLLPSQLVYYKYIARGPYIVACFTSTVTRSRP